MQRAAAVGEDAPGVEVEVERQHRGQRLRESSRDGLEAYEVGLVERLRHGDVERHEGRVPVLREHHGGRLRVVVDVGLGPRRHVARVRERPAHHDEAVEGSHARRLGVGGEVGERTEGQHGEIRMP
ncbi:hypothetical protein HR12_13780 [Microbacterium sp. SUBG005]|nr:hypothetical protein HR12_13780 [Microbacterium sp. SUBG005]